MSEYEFGSAEELIAAYNGEYGPEVEEAAEEELEELGYFDEGDEGDDDLDDDFEDDTAAVADEIERLEEKVGRKLTNAEIDRLIDAIPANGPIPDLAERYGSELAGRAREREGRVALMEEAATDAIRAKEEAEGAEAPPLTPAGRPLAEEED